MDAQASSFRKFGEGRRFIRGFDHSAYPRHLGRVLLLKRGLIRLASSARTKTGPLRIGTRQMEANVFRVGQACGTGWPAVNPRSLDRVVEFAVGRTIACDNGGPSRVLFGWQLSGLPIARMRVHGLCFRRSFILGLTWYG